MYGCDCDGVNRPGPVDRGIEGDSVRASLGMIERVAGYRPPTCPWRAFSEPIVREVLSVVQLGIAALGPDPDAVVVEGLSVYTQAKKATELDEQKILHEEREAKARVMRRG
jgi:hypothetical protein